MSTAHREPEPGLGAGGRQVLERDREARQPVHQREQQEAARDDHPQQPERRVLRIPAGTQDPSFER
jgi:hypothetical protein